MKSVSVNNLARAIYESSSGKSDKELVVLNKEIISIIEANNMLGKTDLILKALEKIIDKEDGIIRIKLSSNKKVSKKIEAEIEEFIKKRYKAKSVIINSIENKNLLGGIKIEIGDEIIDTTLSTKINQLQNYLIAN